MEDHLGRVGFRIGSFLEDQAIAIPRAQQRFASTEEFLTIGSMRYPVSRPRDQAVRTLHQLLLDTRRALDQLDVVMRDRRALGLVNRALDDVMGGRLGLPRARDVGRARRTGG